MLTDKDRRILGLLAMIGRPASPGELAPKDRSNVARALYRMSRDGLCIRHEGAATCYELTRVGRRHADMRLALDEAPRQEPAQSLPKRIVNLLEQQGGIGMPIGDICECLNATPKDVRSAIDRLYQRGDIALMGHQRLVYQSEPIWGVATQAA